MDLVLVVVNFCLSNDIPRWCEGVSWVLSLQSYMFGDTQEAVEVEAGGEEDEEELGEVTGKTTFSV